MKTLTRLNKTYLKSLKDVNVNLELYLTDKITKEQYEEFYTKWLLAFSELSNHIDRPIKNEK